MITKIKKIKNYGIFENYVWPNVLPLLNKTNIIYAHNYSGKTTLSRVFRSFELGQKHPDYPLAEYELEFNDGRTISQINLLEYKDIRVFNTDFVNDNLKWFENDSKISPIFILGKENIELQQILKDLETNLNNKKELKGENELQKNNVNSKIDKELTKTASEIKKSLALWDYTKRPLLSLLNKQAFKNHYQSFRNLDYEKYYEEYNSNEIKEEQKQPLLPDLKLYDLYHIEARKIVETSISAKIIQKYIDDVKLGEWIHQGVQIHNDKELCEFCGNKISQNRLKELNQHFSNDYQELLKDIEDLNTKLTLHIKDIYNYKDNYPDSARFYNELAGNYKSQTELIKSLLTDYIEEMKSLQIALNNKKENPFYYSPLDIGVGIGEISELHNSVSNIFKNHNIKVNTYSKKKERAKSKLINYYVASYIEEEDYYVNCKLLDELDGKIVQLNKDILEIEKKQHNIRSKLSDITIGADRVNEFLSYFFRNESLKIKVYDNTFFELQRKEEGKAKNLSEGEKTVISFSYFLAKLRDRNTVLNKTILFIDDPISSLDNNHIYNIYALIKSQLKDKCLQLFLSTHNMEFMNLFKRNENNISFYFIKRFNGADITGLPNTLKKYKSEYVYIFSLLYNHYCNPKDDYDCLYQIPNLLRRFLESYLGFKKPNIPSWSDKLDILIKDKVSCLRVAKFVDELSHQQTLDRSLFYKDMNETEEILKIVFDALKTSDETHFESLCQCMN